MAALPNTRMTLADLQKYMDPQGKVAPVVELLQQRNEILKDPMWQPGNLPTGHQFSLRTALPIAYLRDYNEGVLPSKSAVGQQTEGMSIIEAWSEVDAAEIRLNGNEAAFRAGEDAAYVQALEQKFAQLLIYGNTKSDTKEINGLATRIASTGNPQFIDCGGTGSDNTSIYVADWGEDMFCVYPKGSEAGLQNVDLGRQIIQFSNGTRMLALVTQYVWNVGLVQRDYRRSVRIGNIDVSDLRTRTTTQAVSDSRNIVYAITDALYKSPDSGGSKVIYMNRTCHAGLAKIGLDKSQSVVTIQEGLTQFGKPFTWLTFLGYPIRCVDRILNTEARVTA